MPATLAKNTALMTLASVGQKIISFVYFTLVARNIGAEGTGKYFFALSFTTIFVVFVDLGLTNVLIREASKCKEKIGEYFSTVLSVKIVLGILSYAAMFFAINALGYPIETRHLVYVSGITMLFDSLHLSLYGVLRAIGDLKYEAISIVGSQITTLGLGTFFLYQGYPLVFLIIAFTIPSMINVLYASIIVWKKHAIPLMPRFQKRIFLSLAVIAIPFAVAAVFARLYSYADTVLLSKLAGDVAVGWYSIPYKITFAFQFIPLALIAALYPRFSEYFDKDKERLARLFEQSMKYLLLIAFPIAVGIAVLAKDIVLSLYTAEYLPSVLPLRILIISLIFSFISFPIGAFLNACNKQVTQTVIVGIALAINIVLNLLLIPKIGVAGAAIAAFAGNALLAVCGYVIVPKITAISHAFLGKTFVQLAISAGVMGIAVSIVNDLSHFTVAILTGAVIYAIMLFLTRTLTTRQLREAVVLIKK